MIRVSFVFCRYHHYMCAESEWFWKRAQRKPTTNKFYIYNSFGCIWLQLRLYSVLLSANAYVRVIAMYSAHSHMRYIHCSLMSWAGVRIFWGDGRKCNERVTNCTLSSRWTVSVSAMLSRTTAHYLVWMWVFVLLFKGTLKPDWWVKVYSQFWKLARQPFHASFFCFRTIQNAIMKYYKWVASMMYQI